MTTRALGGSIPGPTYEIYPGDEMKIKFDNKLKMQMTTPSTMGNMDHMHHRILMLNMFRDPDTSNLHWHGGHTSPKSPGDNTKLLNNKQYIFCIFNLIR